MTPKSIRRANDDGPMVSVVVPVFNEEECLDVLHERLTATLESITDDYEILFVEDGSSDRSLEKIQRLAEIDPHVGYQTFSRNFGHEAATTCGMFEAAGQAVVLIDADLQDPPEVIAEMVERWREGYDVIYAQRRRRAGESRWTTWSSAIFYRVFRRLTEFQAPVDTGDFRLMDRAVVHAFRRLTERSRFVRGLICWTGFRQTAVFYDRDARHAGATKYNFFKRLRLAIDAICGMSAAPLRGLSYAGVAVSAMGICGSFAGLMALLLGRGFSSLAWLAAALFTLSGVQLLAMGLLGEYIGRIYQEAQRRPLYLIREAKAPRQPASRETSRDATRAARASV